MSREHAVAIGLSNPGAHHPTPSCTAALSNPVIEVARLWHQPFAIRVTHARLCLLYCPDVVLMAGYISDSGSDPYGYDLTLSDEERLITLVDRLSTPARAPAPSSAPATRASAPTPTRAPGPAPVPSRARPAARSPPSTLPADRPRPGRTTSFGSDSSSLDSEIKAAITVHEALDGIDENDLDFDITELGSGPEYSHGSASPIGISPPRASPPRPQPPAIQRWLAPSVSSENRSLASFVHKTKPRSAPSMLSDADVRYPDREFASPFQHQWYI